MFVGIEKERWNPFSFCEEDECTQKKVVKVATLPIRTKESNMLCVVMLVHSSN